jgi:hypothetical protein
MTNPPKYIFDGFNVWRHGCDTCTSTFGYVKLDRLKNGTFRVHRGRPTIWTSTALYYVNKKQFSVIKDPENDIVWAEA